MGEPDFQVLRMGGCKLLTASTGRANDQRNGALSTKHGIDFGSMIDNLIHGQHDEIDGHDLHDWAQPQHGSTGGHPDKPIFDNRRVHHAFGAELLQEPGRDFIRSLEGADLFTQ